MSNQERRGHLRYRDPADGPLRLSVEGGVSERALTALMVNESKTGFACVYVGSAVEVGSEVQWQETEAIRTPCTVIRCQPLYDRVYLLAVRIAG